MGTGWAAGGSPGGRRRLGEVLVAGKVLTEAQLDEALRVQREDKGPRRRLGEVITALGLADEVQIARALSDQLGQMHLDMLAEATGTANGVAAGSGGQAASLDGGRIALGAALLGLAAALATAAVLLPRRRRTA